MAFSPLSFLIGVGAAYLFPVVSRNFRPLAVEATAMSLGLVEDLRRVVAERMESLEDIAAEARARREALMSGATVLDDGAEVAAADEAEPAHEAEDEPAGNGTRPRRRTAGRPRSRTS